MAVSAEPFRDSTHFIVTDADNNKLLYDSASQTVETESGSGLPSQYSGACDPSVFLAPTVATSTPPATTAPTAGEQTGCPTSADLNVAYESLASHLPSGWKVIGCSDGYTLAAPIYGDQASNEAVVFQQDGSRLNALGGGTLNNAPGTVENACSLMGVPATTAAKLGCPESPETANPAPDPKVLDEPSGLSCRDLAPKGYTYADAVAYWRHAGTPHRMDEDGDGLPCEGVYPYTDVSAFWGVTD